jgi:hypoxanthine phosphoribosyltransferase
MSHLHVSWDEYHRLIEALVIEVRDSDWDFDVVLGLARGGLRVADVMSRIFDKPMAVLAASSYREGSGTVQGVLKISSSIAFVAQTLGPRVLIVDDLADTGKTLSAVVDHVKTQYGGVDTIRTAVLWTKAHSCFKPDYTALELDGNPWIHQPFERYDTMTPGDLG